MNSEAVYVASIYTYVSVFPTQGLLCSPFKLANPLTNNPYSLRKLRTTSMLKTLKSILIGFGKHVAQNRG